MNSKSSSKPPIQWVNFLFLTLSPVVAIVGTIVYCNYYGGFLWYEWALFYLFMLMTGISITGGYHRLWSHKTYKAHPIVRAFYAFWGACSVQNSVFHWASDHRRHHQYVDDWDKDPYSAKRGFWFSHIGWIIRNYQSGSDDFSNIKDLQEDPILRFQHKYYVYIAFFANLVVPMAIGYAINGNPFGMLILCGFVRLVLNHHFTFFINSLAHIVGTQPYSNKDTSRDSWMLSLFTYGEGYHNFHHTFQNDYRNGIHWYDFDPSKWSIYLLSKMGLTSKLKYTDKHRIEIAIAERRLEKTLEKMKKDGHSHFEELSEQLKQKYDEYLVILEEFCKSKKEWLLAKADNCLSAAETSDLRQRYLELKASFKYERDNWHRLAAI